MTPVVLNKEGLEAAHKEAFRVRTGEIDGDEIDRAISAYLSASLPADSLISALSADNARLNQYVSTCVPTAEMLPLVARTEAAEARVKEMEAALEPFAMMADRWDDAEPDETVMDYHDDECRITLRDCRAARSTLVKEDGSNG